MIRRKCPDNKKCKFFTVKQYERLLIDVFFTTQMYLELLIPALEIYCHHKGKFTVANLKYKIFR